MTPTGIRSAQAGKKLESAQVGHAQVGDYQMKRFASQPLQRHVAIGRRLDLIALNLQNLSEVIPIELHVVDSQNPSAHRALPSFGKSVLKYDSSLFHAELGTSIRRSPLTTKSGTIRISALPKNWLRVGLGWAAGSAIEWRRQCGVRFRRCRRRSECLLWPGSLRGRSGRRGRLAGRLIVGALGAKNRSALAAGNWS